MPELSVVMSVYNGEKFLRPAIESVLSQTFTDFEFIIIDDGSSDETMNILKEYKEKDRRISLIFNETNLGLTRSLNKVLQHVQGIYVARMDADDVVHPDRFAKQVVFLKTFPEIKCVGSNVIEINEEGDEVRKIRLYRDDLQEHIFKRNSLVHGSLMFEKEALKAIGKYDERFRLAQDYDLLVRLAEKFQLGCVDEYLYYLRVSKNTLSNKKFYTQLYFTALAKYHHSLRVYHIALTLRPIVWLYQVFYTWGVIYKGGLPKLVRMFKNK